MRVARIAVVVILGCLPAVAWAADWASHPENVWVKQSPREGAPSPRYLYEGSGAWDPWTRQFIRWGGHDGIPQGFHLFLWDLETGRWQQKFPNTSPPGACCIDGANVFDVANHRFVRFPGASLGHGWQWSRGVQLKRSHVWLYDPVHYHWTNMRPPPYREPPKYSRDVLGSLNAGGTYDANHEVSISFGGQGDAGGMNNLFVYDAYSNRLERLDAANPPSPRDGMGICYDTANDCLVVFGGQYTDDEKTWIYRYRTNRWESHDLTPRPPGKKRKTYSTIPKMVFDSVNGVCVCVVWLEEKGGALETWALDVAKLQWTKMNPAVEPEPTGSRARNMGYDSALNLVFLESVTPKGEARIWTYRFRKAQPTDRPEPPTGLTVVTDPGKAKLTWKPSRSPGVREYRVYRAQTDKPWLAEFGRVGSAKGDTPKYEDSGLEAGKVYIYTVRAVGANGRESRDSFKARTQPPAIRESIVYVKDARRVEFSWRGSEAEDVIAHNVYRGVVHVATNMTSKGSWGYNDPEYSEPVVDRVLDVTGILAVDRVLDVPGIQKVAEAPASQPGVSDTGVDLTRKVPESADYKYAVYAYIVRGVNRLGTESGPSPYVLTIPAEPWNVLLHEKGRDAEIKWAKDASLGYRVYRVDTRTVTRLTPEPIKETTFTVRNAGHARYVVVGVDRLGQEGQPSSPVWSGQSHQGFYEGEWHQ